MCRVQINSVMAMAVSVTHVSGLLKSYKESISWLGMEHYRFLFLFFKLGVSGAWAEIQVVGKIIIR